MTILDVENDFYKLHVSEYEQHNPVFLSTL